MIPLMAEEIELKLALPPTAQRALLRHPLLSSVERRQERLANIYYDTPDLRLHARGIALRLRRQGRVWLQTVKCAGAAAGGLSTRPEWETPYQGALDFAAVDDPAIREWLSRPKIRNRLQPVLETNFSRSIWRLEPAPGQVALAMLDRGWIAAAGRREAISELELELAEGEVALLFELADELAKRLPLTPAVLSKAERGYRLFAGAPPQPVKAAASPVDRGMSPLAAFRSIALSCLDHLQRNHPGALAADDPEFIHQMRVASRRLRAALRLFAPRLAENFAEDWLPGLRTLMAKLGQARDLDVLAEEIVAPVQAGMPDDARLAALAAALAARRHSAREAALQHLRSADYGRLLLRAMAALQMPAAAAATAGTDHHAEAAGSLADFAARRATRLHRRVEELAAAAKAADAPSLHRLRIGIKRLRYALEFFAPLARQGELRRALARLTGLQDELGRLNDLAGAGRLLGECAGDDAALREAVALVGGWHGPGHAAIHADLAERLCALRRLKLPRLS